MPWNISFSVHVCTDAACSLHRFLQTGQELLCWISLRRFQQFLTQGKQEICITCCLLQAGLLRAALFSQTPWASAVLCLDKKHFPEAGELTHPLDFNLNIPPLKLVAECWLRPFKIHRLPCKLIKDLINMTVKFYFCRLPHFREYNRRIRFFFYVLEAAIKWRMAHQKLEFANKGTVKNTQFCWFKQMSNLCIFVVQTQCIFLPFLILLFIKYLASDWRQNVPRQMTQLFKTEKGKMLITERCSMKQMKLAPNWSAHQSIFDLYSETSNRSS